MTATTPFKPHPAIPSEGIADHRFFTEEEAMVVFNEIANHYGSEVKQESFGLVSAAWRISQKPSKDARASGIKHSFLRVALATGINRSGERFWKVTIKNATSWEERDKLREMISHPARPR